MHAQAEDANIPKNQRSLLNAYSIKNMAKDGSLSMALGAEHFSLSSRFLRQRAREGNLAGVGLFGAAAPEDILSNENRTARDAAIARAAGEAAP
jgi:hypothetical protein